jgi:hypothetical protein
MVSDAPLTVTEIASGVIGAVVAHQLTSPKNNPIYADIDLSWPEEPMWSISAVLLGFAMGTVIAGFVTGDY